MSDRLPIIIIVLSIVITGKIACKTQRKNLALPDWLWLFNNKKILKSLPGKDFINPKIQI
ncbi:hypothetical protein [Dolichospermum sp. UHCC 0406]|jgi:hypothetical protein|uniref:hypothetical protein n=1 Tax=Dolichospermum sp. UHCC 0406 TaxID=2590017 RepID=UPI001C2BB53B|nr:hypothetical protein [Dolichospermum sp. UHCC 0406]MTJ18047.1 hypothetical protein [Dolichospermum sp. UHCC 0299]MTJ37297.1 hypothetical protein [Dolichospermum sp. UHCC 0406]